jgi:hypothetical protein
MEKWAHEELDPELRPFTTWHDQLGRMVQHPLIYDIMCVMPGLTNLRLAAKKADLAKAIEQKDIWSIVGLHERPWRLHALTTYVFERDEHSSPLSVWHQTEEVQALTQWVWTDSENIHQHQDDWLNVFRDRPHGMMLGSPSDLAAFDALPDPVRLFRGGGADSFLSWTSEYKTAKFFARRGIEPGEPEREIRSSMIPKSAIFAYFTNRGEAEALSFERMGA